MNVVTEPRRVRHKIVEVFAGFGVATVHKAAAGSGPAVGAVPTPHLNSALQLALRYSAEQGLLPRTLHIADIWAGLPGNSPTLVLSGSVLPTSFGVGELRNGAASRAQP
jgi:hypothetical protein